MRLAAGSFPWLVAHDLRLGWRMFGDMFMGWSRRATFATIAAGLIGLHAAAWVALEFRAAAPGRFGSDAIAAVWAAMLLWMVSQGLLAATRQLYEGRHLDVLFSSPLPVWKSVSSRALAMIAAGFASVAPLTLPLANVGALRDGPVWLSIYPILVALSILGTAAGFILAVGLFYAVGPRRARRISQVLAAMIAGAFVLGIQVAALLPAEVTARIAGWAAGLEDFARTYGAGIVPLTAAAFTGDPSALTALLAMALLVFGVSVTGLSGAFSRASVSAAGTLADAGNSASRSRPFREGVRTSLRWKEWRLLVRDPNLFAQLGLQIVYTLPVVVMLLRSPNEIPSQIALTPFIVVLAAQISSSLAWIAVSGEDAPELIQTAPIGAVQVARAKLSAIAVPVAAILGAPVLVLCSISPWAAAHAIIFGAAAGASTALLNFWHPMPGNRRGLLRRHSQSKVVAIAEHGLSVLWALAVVMAMVDPRLALVPLLPIAGIVWLFKPKSRTIRPMPVGAAQHA